VYSGSVPEGDEAFASLARLGVKTVISVDGMTPDTAAASRHGLRYVHLPVGYDGIPRDKVVLLVKAVRELPGPVYVHCHHGVHRGPAAVAVIQLCTDQTWTPGTAESWLRTVGTDPKYTGLVGIPKTLVPLTAAELAAAPSDIPATVVVSDFVHHMVAVDGLWDHIKLFKAAGWKVPPDHPDLDPPHEAVQLVEHFREAARLAGVERRGPEFLARLTAAESATTDLEKELRKTPADPARLGKAFARSAAACQACHDRFRDNPGDR
jgi:hypothetical protein